nr:uncharacterized protein I303_03225 [Kwoniella dejecticola CBS 10117]OBR87201.1 hypothetical protein I303_03225 [Kwoniella dejecticola CBS 10117]
MAIRIAKTLTPIPDLLVVELAALFHDLDDHKYRTSTSPTLSTLLQPFLTHPSLAPEQAGMILKIIPSVSYTAEIKLQKAIPTQWIWQATCGELHAVQDADRLDAVGSIGIMRCAAFSCKANRKLLEEGPESGSGLGLGSRSGAGIDGAGKEEGEMQKDPVKAKVDGKGQSAEGHFEEKLLLIKDRMKTDFGRAEAERRHQTMVDFLSSLERERAVLDAE